MTKSSVEVMAEKIRVLEREMKEMKLSLKEVSEETGDLDKFRETTLLKLSNIEKSVEAINKTVTKDSGWRGFFLDFIKAAAQIAVLVGAGKWIF